jgi:hypothetical protein
MIPFAGWRPSDEIHRKVPDVDTCTVFAQNKIMIEIKMTLKYP